MLRLALFDTRQLRHIETAMRGVSCSIAVVMIRPAYLNARMGATYAFLFTAKNLQPSFTYDFFANFAMRHYIEGAFLGDQQSAIAELAAASIMIARHTRVVLLYRNKPAEAALNAYEVLWAGKHRPGGMSIPMQCNQCGAAHCFKVTEGSNHRTWQAVCKRCQTTLPQYSLEPQMKAVNASEIGQWYLVDRE